MSKVLFIEYPRCTTCKRAKKWLAEKNIDFEDRHIVEDTPTPDELAAWHKMSGLPIRRFFNTSGMVYREEGIKAKLDAGLSEEECYQLLASNGKLIKRPLVIGEDFVLVGFKEPQWEEKLL